MKIKKFNENIENMRRKDIIDEILSKFEEGTFLNHDINGISFDRNNEILYIHIDKKDKNGNYSNFKVVKLDLSDIGIEIGKQEWNDDKEDFEEFIPLINLDTNYTKQAKEFKKEIKNYNI